MSVPEAPLAPPEAPSAPPEAPGAPSLPTITTGTPSKKPPVVIPRCLRQIPDKVWAKPWAEWLPEHKQIYNQCRIAQGNDKDCWSQIPTSLIGTENKSGESWSNWPDWAQTVYGQCISELYESLDRQNGAIVAKHEVAVQSEHETVITNITARFNQKQQEYQTAYDAYQQLPPPVPESAKQNLKKLYQDLKSEWLLIAKYELDAEREESVQREKTLKTCKFVAPIRPISYDAVGP